MKKDELVNRINNIYWQYNVGPQIVKRPKDLAVLTSITSFGKYVNNGPIGVTKCLFNGEEVTLITLGGTQFKDGQATRLEESKLSFYEKDNDYLKALLKVFKSKDENSEDIIDKNKPIIISGISLGGMIAQQLLSRKEVIENYNIKSIITFGSPLTKPFDRKGMRIKRFVDKNDIVPKMGEYKYVFSKSDRSSKKELDKVEKILENGKYKNGIITHALSYVEYQGFDKYDFYGEINGKNELELLEEMKFYEAPILNN